MCELEKKIYNGENLTKDELSAAVLDDECVVVDTIEGENGRWSQSVKSIIQIEDKLFAIDWERGLTEYQEHNFYLQPYEVERKTRLVEEVYYEEI